MDSYRLVVVSLFFLLLFAGFTFLIRKRKNFAILFVVFSSFLPLISLVRKGVYQSGDFALHIERSVDLWNSLNYGILPVHWASILNATYGYPLFIFAYPLPYYSIAFLKLLGLSFIFSEKVLLALTFVLSGIGMYKLSRLFLKAFPSIAASVLYLFAPYHLVDLHFRVAIGELFAYAFLPFIFYYAYKLSKKFAFSDYLLCALCYAGLILSHQAITIVASPFIFALPFLLKKANARNILFALTTGVLLSAFYWLPAVVEIHLTHQSTFGKSISFENIVLYIISPWRYGFLYQGPTGQISFPMGFVQMSLLAISSVIILKKKIPKTHKKLLITLHCTFFFLFLLLFPFSLPVWKTIPFMTNFQFAYRLMLPISFVLAIIGGITAQHMDKKLIVLILFLAIGSTILNWGTRGVIKDIGDEYLIRHALLSTGEGEGLQAAVPKWRSQKDLWFKTPPLTHLQVEKGDALVRGIKRTPTMHLYSIHVLENASFRENTLYFPGWNLYVNGIRNKTTVDTGKTGLIGFKLNKGSYKVVLKFEETYPRILGNTISLISLVLISLVSLFHVISQRRK